MKADRAWAVSVVAGLVVGAFVAAWILGAAWDHNPQREFHEPGVVHWAEWLSVAALWFAAVAAVVTLAARMLLALARPSSSGSDRDRTV